MKSLNLIIDFKNIAMRSLFTCQYVQGVGDVKNFDNDEECGILGRKIVTDISFIIKTFNPQRVIFACDSRNYWRKSLYDDIEGEDYKGTRKYDDEKDWTKIYETFDNVRESLSNKGFITSSVMNAEADDMAALWSKYLMDNGEDVILVSSDKDWTQLVSFDTDKKIFCACYNPIANNRGQKKLYISYEIDEWLNTEDKVDIFFTNFDSIKNKIKNIESVDSKIYKELIDPERVVLDKIMCGDTSDNVPAFFSYYKNGKKVRVTPLKAGHVFESLNIHNVNDLIRENDSHALKDALEREMRHDIDVDFEERLMRQRKMVELNISLFPINIVDDFNKHVERVKDTGYITSTNMISMDKILEGTKYITKDYKNKVKENSIFDDFTSLSKYSKSFNLFK